MTARRSSRYAVLNTETGEVRTADPREPQIPFNFDGKNYTMCALPGETDVPLTELFLSAAEWNIIECMKSAGADHTLVKVNPADLALSLNISETTAKTSVARLVAMHVLLKPTPRAGVYQLNPRRWWRGKSSGQREACVRLRAPAITPDRKAKERLNKIKDK